ncbi:hypothetical protein CYMTET_54427 [Cymbomonas tetramitiformis]|uniref:Uncharacterized protein n=1 Tax=Cymbomonas tetramitiformis TaxID=36881 RepID=A0AAE0EP19_9CHLO|nr:hypothetical protein CYMTET_54427 [Cymbomonas tetramitiformis]
MRGEWMAAQKTFEDVGGTVLPGGCELSVAMWRREHSSAGASVISSHNLELPPLDADDTTPHFTASPEITTAMTLVGSLHFNPESDLLAGDDSDGDLIKPPTGAEFPKSGLPSV